eukprot:354470-Chlamydomonas_euryale.AAC.52
MAACVLSCRKQNLSSACSDKGGATALGISSLRINLNAGKLKFFPQHPAHHPVTFTRLAC